MGRSQDLYKRAKTLIPGGTQLLSKRPEMFLPEYWPAYYDRAKGCEVWDLDGKHYHDFSYMAIGACILGYADEDVDRAVEEVVRKGNINTLNAPEEVKLAELLIELHPWSDMVRYARSGGEAMSIAVRIARAYSKKDVVMFCGYHGWHDWYLASNLADSRALDGHLLPGLEPAGVPRSLKGSAVPFHFNNTQEFLQKFERLGRDVGAVVIEIIRNDQPQKEFLTALREQTSRNAIPLIMDEITSGWRLNLGGAHLLYDLEPDVAVFAKAISNGFPMAAIIGKRSVMEAAQESFISSSYWTERIGPTAAITTIEKLRDLHVSESLISTGKTIKEIWKKAAQDSGLQIHISGIDPLGHFDFVHLDAMKMKTFLTQEMLGEGYLASTAFYASLSHSQEDVQNYGKALSRTFDKISKGIQGGGIDNMLKGPVCHSGFSRLN